ncbi:GNAT family N-acetyltransferase [Acidihalobacter yilgarnensis]|uniref:GNAT family N-acetyltransferase n=1 Tax=Acidihalobacter yilgarnensis TaxID=2819280 RepID=A0A1D8IRK7_9GAMM|nr:GNAT family N-acetyltransferase [Acidihalobacter yilgarnensis]AOU99131.1 GNAT family N-acetyltransferase [Acidihalobacter yilgarnensis]
MPDPTLLTTRLLLRAFNHADAPDVQRLAGDRAIADTTLNVPHPYEVGMAEAWIAGHDAALKSGHLQNFAITLREGGTLIGAIGLTIEPRFERAELGYWIGRPYWGRGYCTEAGKAVLRHGFIERGLNRIHASHFVRNPASGRMLDKLGLQPEGMLRQHARRWEDYEDLILYGLLRQDWSAALDTAR